MSSVDDENDQRVATFRDSKQEWRRLFSELFGTFLLVVAAAGGGMVAALSHGAVSRSAEVAAPGLTVMAVILFMGKISGAHLNPAVSLAFAMRRDFPWRRVPGYVVTQFLGATLACLFLLAVLGNVGGLGATQPGPEINGWQALLIETVLTLGLVSTILGTASGAQNVGPLSALAVGAIPPPQRRPRVCPRPAEGEIIRAGHFAETTPQDSLWIELARGPQMCAHRSKRMDSGLRVRT